MSTRWPILILVLLLAPTIGCNSNSKVSANNSSELNGRLNITGSSTVAPLVAEIAKRFESLHPKVRIDVQTGGSGKGISDTRNQVADIGMASRALKEEEKDLTAHQIAADGVCIITHSQNLVKELTAQNILDIYYGRKTNWNDFGGSNKKIIIVHKAEGRATLEVFLKHFKIDNTKVKADVIVGDNEHGVKTVAGTDGAIGYVSIGTAEANVKSGTTIRLLPLAGIEANSENVASGKFPMSRPLNLITAESDNPLANKFIKYCQSKEVHDLVISQYFVPFEN